MKSKKRWFVTALTACLTLSLGICAEALEYDFDGVEDTEYYPSTSYESLYGAKYNYGGSNATDYQWQALPYGVSSNASVGCMEKVRFPGLVGSIGGSGIESNITNPIQQEPQIPSTSYQSSAYTSVDGMERKDGSTISRATPAALIFCRMVLMAPLALRRRKSLPSIWNWAPPKRSLECSSDASRSVQTTQTSIPPMLPTA